MGYVVSIDQLLISKMISEIVFFIIGTIVGGLFGRVLPDIIKEWILAPNIKFTDLKCVAEGDEYIYYVMVENKGRKKAKNCAVWLNFYGQGKLDHHGQSKTGKIELDQWTVLWENGEKEIDLKRGEEMRAEILKISQTGHNYHVHLNSHSGYGDPYKILKVNGDERGTNDIRDFQSLDWCRKEVNVVSENKRDSVTLSNLPWDNPGADIQIQSRWPDLF